MIRCIRSRQGLISEHRLIPLIDRITTPYSESPNMQGDPLAPLLIWGFDHHGNCQAATNAFLDVLCGDIVTGSESIGSGSQMMPRSSA